MACANNVMQQETQYLSLMQQATKFEISGDQLTLFDSSGIKLLIYKKHVPVPLTGTWNLFNYNNGKGGYSVSYDRKYDERGFRIELETFRNRRM